MIPDALEVTWDGCAAAELARRCRIPRVELLAETDSTQDVAHALAEAGATAGTTVLADAQRAGRGRLGRAWSSPSGQGVWCTVIERPHGGSALDVLSLRVGLRCAQALDAFARRPVGLKWPNDLVVQTPIPSPVIPRSAATRDLQFAGSARDQHLAKLGGILVEARWAGDTLGWVAIGVGVNVVAPQGIANATGLMPDVSRVGVLEAVVRAVRAAARITGHLTADELTRYAARDALAGRRIVQPVAGLVVGVAANGSVIVGTANGTEQMRAGTILLETEEHA